jgi:hypothetical protein
VNLNSAVNQSGTVGSLDWDSYNNNGGTNPAISSSTLFNATDGTGNSTSRAALDYDISDSSVAIVAGGGFEVSFTQTTGIGFTGSVHGGYGSSIFLSQSAIVKSASGTTNPWQGLALQIRGNGQVVIYSQGSQINTTTTASVWNLQGANDIRLVVATNGFLTTSTNSVSIYVNDTIVNSDLSFNWKSNDDVYLGLEAVAQSASFDNVTLSTIPEPSTYALLAGCFALASVMIRRRR